MGSDQTFLKNTVKIWLSPLKLMGVDGDKSVVFDKLYAQLKKNAVESARSDWMIFGHIIAHPHRLFSGKPQTESDLRDVI